MVRRLLNGRDQKKTEHRKCGGPKEAQAHLPEETKSIYGRSPAVEKDSFVLHSPLVMKSEDITEEKIIKTILYEVSMQEKLLAHERAQSSKRKFILIGVGGLLLAGLILWFWSSISSNTGNEGSRAMALNYEFPIISASRSSEINIIDKHLAALENEEYQTVLSQLESQTVLSAKDKFVKSHLYYVTESLSACKKISQPITLDDPYYQAHQWLLFMVGYRQKESVSALNGLVEKMDLQHRNKAVKILNQTEVQR